MRAARVAGRLPARQDRLAVRRLHRSRRAGRRRPTRRPGAPSACGWARPTRWPTTSATWSPTRRRWASRPGATWRCAGRVRPASSAWAARSRTSTAWWRVPIAAVPDCRGAALLRAMVRAEAERLVPAGQRARPGAGARRRAMQRRAGSAHAARAWRRPMPQPARLAAHAGATAGAPGATACSPAPTSSAARARLSADAADRAAPRARRCSTWWPASSTRRCCWPACGCALFEILAEGPADARRRWRRALRPAAAGRRAPARRRGGAGPGRAAQRRPLRPGPARRADGRQRRPSPRWSSTTPCSTPTCATRWRCCAAQGERAGAGALLGLCRGRRRRAQLPRARGGRLLGADVGLAAAGGRARCSTPTRCSGHRCLLDVGGGEGRFLAAAAQRAPHLQLMLFDLPARWPSGRGAPSPRSAWPTAPQAFGGDFLRDALPAGADIVSLVRVLLRPRRRRARWPSCAPCAARCRPAARCCWPSRWPARPARRAWATPTSASTCWPWAAGAPRTAARAAALLHAAGFDRVRELPHAACRCRSACWSRARCRTTL